MNTNIQRINEPANTRFTKSGLSIVEYRLIPEIKLVMLFNIYCQTNFPIFSSLIASLYKNNSVSYSF